MSDTPAATDFRSSRKAPAGPGVTPETSYCPLTTSFGTMQGSYQMAVLDGSEPFDAEIAAFALGEPHSIN